MLRFASELESCLLDPSEDFNCSGELYFYKIPFFKQWLLKLHQIKIAQDVLLKVYFPQSYLHHNSLMGLKNKVPLEFQEQVIFTELEDVLSQFSKRLVHAELYIKARASESIIHPSASIHPSAVVEGSVGEGSTIGPFVYIASGSSVGNHCRVDSHVSIYNQVRVGDSVELHAHAVIGSPGFGYDPNGQLIPHLAGVDIQSNCRIGSQTVIAAGCLRSTFIGKGSQLDSFVQIGHHVQLGEGVMMASQSGIGGSTHVGSQTQIAGGAQIKDSLSIGARVKIAAKAGVVKDLADDSIVGGFPAIPIFEWHRQSLQALKKSKNAS